MFSISRIMINRTPAVYCDTDIQFTYGHYLEVERPYGQWLSLHIYILTDWRICGSHSTHILQTMKTQRKPSGAMCLKHPFYSTDVFIIREIYYRLNKSNGKGKKSRKVNWLHNVCLSPWIDQFYISRLKWQREIKMLTKAAGRNEMLYH